MVRTLAAFACLAGANGFQVQRGVPDLDVSLEKMRDLVEASDRHRDVEQAYQPPHLMPEMPSSGPSQKMTKDSMNQMRLHPDDKDKQFGGCGVLAWRIGFDNHKDWLLREGLVHNVMKALTTYREDKDLQWLCAGALSSAALNNKAIAEAAGNEGFMEILMDMPGKWASDPKMQVYSMAGNMMSASENNRKRWIAAGGMKQVMTALFEWPHDHNVKLSALTALEFAVHDDPMHFLKYGGQLLMMQILKEEVNDAKIVEEVLKIGEAVSTDPSCWAVMLNEKKYIERVINAMQVNKDDIFLQDAGCKNLAIFAKDPNTRAIAMDAGAVEVAVDVIQFYEDRKAQAKSHADALHLSYAAKYQAEVGCLAALSNFTVEPKAKEVLVKARNATRKGKKGQDFLDKLKFKHAYEADVSAQIGQVIKSLDDDTKAKKK